jgi:hypothetical protein
MSVLVSAYEGWKMNNGNVNASKSLENFEEYSKQSLDPSYSGRSLENPEEWATMPGIVRIPVCDWSTWEMNHKNWGNSKRQPPYQEPPCPEYPCCPPEALPYFPKDDRDHAI